MDHIFAVMRKKNVMQMENAYITMKLKVVKDQGM